MSPPLRIDCRDSLAWLSESPPREGAVATSLPDAAELDVPPNDWYCSWFMRAAQLCFEAGDPEMPTAFFQTDRYHNGAIVDKGHLLALASTGHRLLGFSIFPRSLNNRRPGYSWLRIYGRADADLPRLPARVWQRGGTTWGNATPESASIVLADYLVACGAELVVDPFIGSGALVYSARRRGIKVWGADISPEAVREAEDLLGPGDGG